MKGTPAARLRTEAQKMSGGSAGAYCASLRRFMYTELQWRVGRAEAPDPLVACSIGGNIAVLP